MPQLLNLWNGVYAEGAFLAKGPPPEDRVRSTMERVVKECIPNFVAIDGNKVVGTVEVSPGTMCGKN